MDNNNYIHKQLYVLICFLGRKGYVYGFFENENVVNNLIETLFEIRRSSSSEEFDIFLTVNSSRLFTNNNISEYDLDGVFGRTDGEFTTEILIPIINPIVFIERFIKKIEFPKTFFSTQTIDKISHDSDEKEYEITKIGKYKNINYKMYVSTSKNDFKLQFVELKYLIENAILNLN